MTQQELTRWLRNEHQIVADLSSSLLQKVASVPYSNLGPWLEDLKKAFEHLRAHLMKHMVLEEQGGYLSVVMEVRPTLEPEVAKLGHEHAEFSKLMNQIHETLNELRTEDHLLIRDVCNRIQNFLGYLDYHNRSENLLVTTALSQDLGAKD